MLIGEVSRKTGLSRDAIRYYEKFGLLPLSAENRKTNNYRDYSADDLKKLFLIQLLHEYGFTLREIKDLIIKHEASQKPFDNMGSYILVKIDSIDRELQKLQNKKARLQALATCYI
jgi:MerR family copper efflux transcriptional regulator